MLVWRGQEDVDAALLARTGGAVVSVGLFDGVHRGHQHVLSRAVELAGERGLPAVAVTFEPNPLVVLRPELAPPRLTTLDRRLELFAGLGLDAALVLPFTRELAALPPEEFARETVLGLLQARAVVVGEDFRFGRRAAGDVVLLRELAAAEGAVVEGLSRIGGEAVPWSSTAVRERVAAGDVAGAAQVLGRPHRLEGRVVQGDRRGRELGYPTANLDVGDLAVPADGVYAGWLRSSYGALPAAVSIGTNPTFDGTERRVEAYALDREDLELYGQVVAVDLVHRLRDTVRFGSVEELLTQMAADVGRARGLLERTSPD